MQNTIGILTDEDYGPLLPFLQDTNVTDINWNGRQLWVDDITRGRYLSDVVLEKHFVDAFSTKITNKVNKSFNAYSQLLEAETEDLRISIIHESAALSGRTISIRKTPAVQRLDRDRMIKEGYGTREMIDLLQNFVESRCNIVVCGLPGVGKTELVKWMTNFIAPDQRVITIEDNLELHYSAINPHKDSVELKVSLNEDEGMTYSDAIKAALRQFPTWIVLSEARGKEAKNLLEALSTGCHCLTTVHTNDIRKLPDRFKNMIGDNTGHNYEDEIFESINVAVLVKKRKRADGSIMRYISQIGVFNRSLDGKNTITLLVDNAKMVGSIADLPSEIKNRVIKAEENYISQMEETDAYIDSLFTPSETTDIIKDSDASITDENNNNTINTCVEGNNYPSSSSSSSCSTYMNLPSNTQSCYKSY